MYEQQQQGESEEEDCEVYFLKPVNEYNIVDKIKEANKELFATNNEVEKSPPQPPPPIDCSNNDETNETITITTEIATNSMTTTTTTTTTIRKVTFAPNLEDYEPDDGGSGGGATTQQQETELQTNDFKEKLMKTTTTTTTTTTNIEIFPTIEEQEEQNEIPQQIEEGEGIEESLNESTRVNEPAEKSFEKQTVASENYIEQVEDDIDEICEEIIIMEMDGSNNIRTAATLTKEDSLQQRRLMLKQTTFDYDEQDNKSLTNLLNVSDDDDEVDNDDNTYNITTTTHDNDDSDANDANNIFMGIDNFDFDDDDDDKLSLIVASYLDDKSTISANSNTTTTAAATKTKTNRTFFRRCGSGKCKNRTTATTSATVSTTTTTFGKRFQLRRKANSINSIGAICMDSTAAASANSNSTSKPTKSEITELKLNYKTCCEYRNSIRGKLPKYTGYLSEYGLSREQIQEREQQLQKKQRFVLQQTLRANEDELQKMQDNERAFTTWLKNKMRYPINKTRNMFDVKLRKQQRKKFN